MKKIDVLAYSLGLLKASSSLEIGKNVKIGIYRLLLISSLFISISLIIPLSSAAPITPNDNWRIVFDSGIDAPYNYSTSFTPKVWLYDQGGNPKTGATLTCSYFNVNDNVAITPCTVTSNGDGSYKSSALNMPTYAGKYINVLFSVSAGSYTLKEQHVFFAGQSNAAHGALWKIQVLNTSLGPSWNGNNQQKIYIKLYSDAGTPYRNNFNDVTIAINGSTPQPMTYLEDGIYSYSISGYANGEHYFEVYNQWSGAPTGGVKSRQRNTIAYAGFYLEANSAQGDESSPEILSVERKPYFPVNDDYVNITVHAVDNGNLASRTLYYSVNNQSLMTKSMDALTGIEYMATLVPYLLEDNVRYRVEISDGTNSVSSDWNNYNVQDRRGEPNNSHSFLSHPAYWFGKSRQASFVDRGGDTNFDGTYSTAEKDNAAYLSVPLDYQYFKDMTRIKVQTLILDQTGKPVQSLTNVRAWLSNNTKQSVGTHNREKNMTEDPSKGPGVYTATWEGSADVSGTNLVWSDDAKAIWANYTSGEIYSVYIDLTNDGQPEENVTWLAYTFGDTFWGSSENGKTWGGHTDLESPSASCNKASCHDMTGELTSRSSGSATCPDCHGVYKSANNGIWPVETGNSATEDKMVYGNGTGHPRLNNTNATYCGDETCHDVAWGSTSIPSPGLIAIPGYPAGTRLNGTFRAEYPNPIQCGEHHTYTAAKIPVEEGHNSMVACKYCHGGSHDNVKLKDFSISIQGTNLSNINRGTPGYIGAAGANGKAGDCYIDCHKTQVEHSLTGKPGGATINYAVPCDECHQNFDNASVHQENMFPYTDREWCGTCHQALGDLSSTRHNTSSPLDPSRIPAIQKHAQETGMRWNRTGERPFWVENEQSCRFCHGRSYNEAYGMGKMKTFMGTNVLNGTINSTGHWCSSCHVNSSSQDYSNMVNTYNYSFGVVPPEITGSTWKSDRAGYDNHSDAGVNRSNPSTYSDNVCFPCHNGSLSPTVSMDTWEHQVSATGIQEQPTDTYIPPVPTSLASTQGNFWVNYTWQAGSGNVTNSYNVSVNSVWTNGSASNTSNNTLGSHGWSNISMYAYNTSGTGKLSLTAVSQQTRVANNVPVQSLIGNKAVTAGDILSFTVSATDADSDVITYGTNATKGTLTPSSGAYTWTTTPGDVGTYIWQFNSSDSYGGVSSETITVIVSAVPTYIPPTPSGLTSTQGNFWVNYTWQAGSGNVTNSYNVSVNSVWTNGTTLRYSNTTVGPHGWSNISVFAYNNSGIGKLSLASTSQNTRVSNNVPVQAPIGNKAVSEGELLTFTVSATDADSDVMTYRTNSTKGTLNSTTGIYSWTPGYADAGVYFWEFNSSDNYGGVDPEVITVTVNNVPLAITSSSPVSDPVTTVGTAQTFAISLNRTATVTWYINGSLVQTNSSVASASYTNSTAGIGIRNVTASATDGIDSTSRKWNWTVSSIPTYKISGYVFDNYGTGLASVLVQNGSNQTTTQASGYYLITGMYNGTYNFSYSKDGFNPGYLVLTINGADVINANKTILDTTPPGQVTGLVNATPTTTTINLSWTPTANASYYQIFRNSSLKGTTQNTYWNDTGLTSDSTYQYWVRANDSYNNWGQNSTTLNVRTASVGDSTPPASVTNLVNVSYAQNYINWTWTDPSDTDFAKVMIYLNGIYQNNVSKGVKYFNATVSLGTYTIGTRTVDTTGNINATIVTHTATTILPSTRYINGTVMDSITEAAISGVTVTTNSSLSTTTNATGFYSFTVTEGAYGLTANLDPIYYTNSTITVSTVGSAVVVQDIELVKKPTGTITGSVKTA